MNEVGTAVQAEVAQMFAALAMEQACGPGTLCLLTSDLPLGLAVTGRGGACLSLLADAAEARVAARMGATDFTVDTLSEALRILKNELRQRRPVSVGVVGDAPALADEMLVRGVQPDTLCLEVASPPCATFVERGAVLLTPLLARGQAGMFTGWTLENEVAASAADRRAGDRLLLESDMASEDERPANIARQWLLLAPRLFPRDRRRWYWVRRMQQEGVSQ